MLREINAISAVNGHGRGSAVVVSWLARSLPDRGRGQACFKARSHVRCAGIVAIAAI